MSVNLQSQWYKILKDVEPQAQATSHSWICETQREGQKRQYEVLSEQEYRDLASQNSWWKTYCEKLSLQKIISISVGRMNTPPSTSRFLETILNSDTFSSDFDADKLLALYAEETTVLFPQAVQILDKMCQRSVAKHAALKTQGVWGKIKFTIWSWFYDNSSWVESLKKRAGSLTPSLTKEQACADIKFRIFVNIESFEDAAAPLEGRWTRPISEEEYQTPRDVKRKWITKYAEDKFHPTSGDPRYLDAIDTLRKRIVVLYQLWDKLIAYQPESNLTPPVEQELLLTGPQAP